MLLTFSRNIDSILFADIFLFSSCRPGSTNNVRNMFTILSFQFLLPTSHRPSLVSASINRLPFRSRPPPTRAPCRLAFDPTPQSSPTTTSTTTTVTLNLPLGFYLEETPDGVVFIDELVPDGNAAKSGLVKVGDIITAVSLPFGDAIHPVPSFAGLDMVEQHITSRDDDTFRITINSSQDIQSLRDQVVRGQYNELSIERMQEMSVKINVPEYPILPPEAEEELSEADRKQSFLDYGFDSASVEQLFGNTS